MDIKSFVNNIGVRGPRARLAEAPPIKAAEEPTKHFSYTDWLRYDALSSGTLRLSESIREETTAVLLSEIALVKRRKPKAVEVRISSPGGGAYYALAIYDALRDLSKGGTTVIAIAEGMAASAAAMIVLQAADHRYSMPNARFLLHEIRRWVFFAMERTSDIQDEAKEMERLTKQIIRLIAVRCDRTPKEIEELIERKEVWMSAAEAKEWGLIDSIL